MLFPITTERLRLRELSEADLEKVHELHSLPETNEFNTLGVPDTVDVTLDILSGWLQAQQEQPRTDYILCVEGLHSREFIGLIALVLGRPRFRNGEVWYKTHPLHWGQGYTSEALSKLLEMAFLKLQLHRVEAGCATENIASIRVLEKAGFIKEGGKRKALPVQGKWLDNYEYAILEEDFLRQLKGR